MAHEELGSEANVPGAPHAGNVKVVKTRGILHLATETPEEAVAKPTFKAGKAPEGVSGELAGEDEAAP